MTEQGRFASASVAAVVLVLVAAPVGAATPQPIGSYRDWHAYTFNSEETNGQICYIASVPTEQDGNYTRRGNPAVLVTRRPGGEGLDEVSVQPGYSYLGGSEVTVTIDGDSTFRLFTQGEHAWARTPEEDRRLIEAMKGGVTMKVHGTSTRQTYSDDTYSLLGFTRAYESMVQACSD
jgi:hypothetical protein